MYGVEVLLRIWRRVRVSSPSNVLCTSANVYLEQLEKLRENSQWEPCWKTALLQLETDCRSLKANDDTRSKLAIAFTNCHLVKSGLTPYTCTKDMSVRSCTKDMLSSSIAFNTYTEFSTHVDNVCFYIQAELFQQKTEDLVNDLVNESAATINSLKTLESKATGVSIQLEEAEKLQNSIRLEQQKLQSSVHEMNLQEREYFEKLVHRFVDMNKISDQLKKGIELISEEQQLLKTQQESFSVKQHNSIQSLNTVMIESLKHSSEMKDVQVSIRSDLDALKQSQQQVKKNTQESLAKQEILIQSQAKLSSQQTALYEKLSHSMQSLQDKSDNIQVKMEKSLQFQDTLLAQQESAKRHLSDLRKAQEQSFVDARNSLNSLLLFSKETANNVRQSHQSFERSFNKVSDLIQKVLGLHSSLLGEFMSIQTVFFYVVCIILAHLLTSTRQTSSARVYLYLVLSFNLMCEYLIISLIGTGDARIWTHTCIWLSRKVHIIVAVLVLGRSVYLYEDLLSSNSLKLNTQTNLLLQLKDHQRSIETKVEKSLKLLKMKQASLIMDLGEQQNKKARESLANYRLKMFYARRLKGSANNAAGHNQKVLM